MRIVPLALPLFTIISCLWLLCNQVTPSTESTCATALHSTFDTACLIDKFLLVLAARFHASSMPLVTWIICPCVTAGCPHLNAIAGSGPLAPFLSVQVVSEGMMAMQISVHV